MIFFLFLTHYTHIKPHFPKFLYTNILTFAKKTLSNDRDGRVGLSSSGGGGAGSWEEGWGMSELRNTWGHMEQK